MSCLNCARNLRAVFGLKGMMRRVVVALAVSTASAAVAAPQIYAPTQQNIRAGVVILDSAKPNGKLYGRSAAPFALYNLEHALQVKPSGWNFYNPHAPAQVTQDIVNRWVDILGASSDLPVLGAPIGKNKAEYWSVHLSQLHDSALYDYDLLLVNPANYAQLSPAEAEKLRKFVDKGGVLWIDPAGVAVQDPENNFPLAFLNQALGGGISYSNPFDRLLTYPKAITASDLNYLHSAVANGMQAVGTSGDATLDTFYGSVPSEFYRYRTVTAVGTTPTISVAPLGTGVIVVTSTGASLVLNRNSGDMLGGNVSYSAEPTALENDGLAAAKLAINMMFEVGDFREPGGGSRKSGGGPLDVTAPVLTRWFDEVSPPVVPSASPVLYKGVFVATTGDHLTIYKADPSQDLDGDGNPDDGTQDASLGAPYDIVWTSASMPTPLSAPVCVEVPDTDAGSNLPADEVLVTDGNGVVHVFGLFDKNNGQLIGGVHPLAMGGQTGYGGTYTPGTELYEIEPPAITGAAQLPPLANAIPNAPTVSEDLAFVSDATNFSPPSGRVWVIDLTSGQYMESAGNPWYIFGPTLPGFTAPATVGYIPIADNSDGFDRVIYAPGLAQSYGPAFASMWFGVKGESPTPPDSVQESAGVVTITPRAATNGNLQVYFPPGGASQAQKNLAPRLTLIDPATGAPLTQAQMSQVIAGPLTGQPNGQLTFNVNENQTFPAKGWLDYGANGPGVRLDYTIDWGVNAGSNTQLIQRGQAVALPAPILTSPGQYILGSIALAPSGTLCMTTATPTSTGNIGGSLYWFREDQGRGRFRMTGRFSVYSANQIPTNQGTTVSWPPVVENYDPLLGFLGGLFGTQLNTFGWSGAPVVVGNQVYALAEALTPVGNTTASAPVTVVMAFAADPSTPTFHLNNLPAGFQILQPDFDKAGGVINTMSALGQGDFSYDPTTGSLQLNSMTGNSWPGGQIQNAMSLSQPVIIRASGVPDIVLDPNTVGDPWSPMLWYSVFLGTRSFQSPLVTGGTLFFAGQSSVPNILTNGSFAPNGVVSAMDSVISTNDAANITHPGDRPYMNQVNQIDTASGFAADPHIRMPGSLGVKSFADYVLRLNQTKLGTSTMGFGLAGGGDTVVAWGDKGIYGMSRADFLVCDQGRLVRVDSSGNALYASNSNVNAGPGGGGYAGNVTELVRPTRAYPISRDETLVVDTGGNRIVKLDSSGLEERAIDKFFPDPDPKYKPAGYQTNEPLNLSAPRDAITYSGYVYKSVTGQVVSSQKDVEYWVHYLIADSGHKRLVELIDRYMVDPNTLRLGPLVTVSMPDPNAQYVPSNGTIPTVNVPQAGVLWWQTPSSVSGKNFDYNSVSRVFLNSVSNTGRYVYVAGIGSTQPSRADVGLDNPAGAHLRQSATGNGGVVVFDPQAQNGIQVYNVWHRPDLTTTAFWDPSTSTFDTTTAASTPDQPGRALPGVMAVTARAVQSNGKDDAQIMVSTNEGAFEFTVDPTTTSNDLGYPDWFINNAAFTAIRTGNSFGQNAFQFRPGYARRLASGEVLVVNSYTGVTQRDLVSQIANPYRGEVMLLDGSPNSFGLGKQNLGFTISSIHFNLPSISGARDLIAPVFADQR